MQNFAARWRYGFNTRLSGRHRSSWLTHYFYVAAILFAAAGLFHFYDLLFGAGATAFHALFAGIDLIAAMLLVQRPLWLAHLFVLLALEQMLAHGSQFLQAAMAGMFDPVSAFIVGFMPLTALLLYADRKRQSDGLR
jgi:hypothetical protein